MILATKKNQNETRSPQEVSCTRQQKQGCCNGRTQVPVLGCFQDREKSIIFNKNPLEVFLEHLISKEKWKKNCDLPLIEGLQKIVIRCSTRKWYRCSSITESLFLLSGAANFRWGPRFLLIFFRCQNHNISNWRCENDTNRSFFCCSYFRCLKVYRYHSFVFLIIIRWKKTITCGVLLSNPKSIWNLKTGYAANVWTQKDFWVLLSYWILCFFSVIWG